MPKKAVALFFAAAFLGAVLYVYFTFPRTKGEIPQSNNQRPFPSAPQPGPNGVPVPEPAPNPNTPKVPPGPSLRAMAWGNATETQALEVQADAFSAGTGRHVSFTIDTDLASYRADLQQALASGAPPDVCLVDARNFAGLDPAHDLVDAPAPGADVAPRSVAAFTVGGAIKAVPDEFSVEVLFYNPSYFDQAGFGDPGPHWTWDILESITRGITAQKLKDPAGDAIYPLELPADFDLWNILCTEAGRPVLDQDVWHLADPDAKDAHERGLDLIHEIFQEFVIAAPLPKPNEPVGRYFAQQRAAILIGPSALTATLPSFPYAMTVLPSDLTRASLAHVNGWAVTAKSPDPDAARALATYLAWQPVHAGWTSTRAPKNDEGNAAVCYQTLDQALVPRIEPRTAQFAQFLDQQINLLARTPVVNTDELYGRIQSEYQSETSPPAISGDLPQAAGQKPTPKAATEEQIRGL